MLLLGGGRRFLLRRSCVLLLGGSRFFLLGRGAALRRRERFFFLRRGRRRCRLFHLGGTAGAFRGAVRGGRSGLLFLGRGRLFLLGGGRFFLGRSRLILLRGSAGTAATAGGRAGRCTADHKFQLIAGHRAVVIAGSGVHPEGAAQHRGVYLSLYGGLAGSLCHLGAVDIPADAGSIQILALEGSFKGVGIPQHSLAAAADLDRGCRKHSSHIHVLVKIGVGAGALGHAIAPLDEHIAVLRYSSHGYALGGTGHLNGKRLAALIAAGQGAAASFIHTVTGLILCFVLDNRGGSHLRAAGRFHRRAGVGGILGAGGDVTGVRAAILGLIGMGAQILQQHLQACGLEVDIAALVVIDIAVAVGVLERLGRVEELDAQLLAHGQQCHIEIINAGLVHVRVVGVVGRDRRHRVDDDIGIGIAGLNGLHQRGVVADKVLGIHAVIVGAQHDDHPAGLHFGHRLRDGVAVIVPLKGDDALVQGGAGSNAFFRAELLQRDQTVGVQAHRVGIADKKGLLLIGVAGIGSLGEQRAGGLVDLVVVGDILLPFRGGRGGNNGRIPRLLRRVLAPLEHGKGDADGQQRRQCTNDAHQHRLFLHRGQCLILLLVIASHILSILLPKE